MGKRVVIALGGNALGNNLPEQMIAVKQTARAIVDLIEEGHEVIIAHGNGPQVGMIQKAMAELTRSEPVSYTHLWGTPSAWWWLRMRPCSSRPRSW